MLNHQRSQHSLVDRGANGGIAGTNLRKIADTGRKISISGIDNHQMNDMPVITAGGVAKSQYGDVILIFHQYAYNPLGKTIHSSLQLEHFKNIVNDKSMKVPGGTQSILTNDGHIFPLDILHGLPYMSIRPFKDAEWEVLPHVIMTSDEEWDPSVLDHRQGVGRETQIQVERHRCNKVSSRDELLERQGWHDDHFHSTVPQTNACRVLPTFWGDAKEDTPLPASTW